MRLVPVLLFTAAAVFILGGIALIMGTSQFGTALLPLGVVFLTFALVAVKQPQAAPQGDAPAAEATTTGDTTGK